MIAVLSIGAQMERESIAHRLNSGRAVAKDKCGLNDYPVFLD